MLRQKSIYILAIVFLATLLFRYNAYYTFREFNTDKARQLHGAYNLLQKKGVSLESYDLTHFRPLLKPINDWPPAYSYFTAAVAFVTGTDLYTSSVVLDFITLTGLWFILLWMSRLLSFTLLQQILLFVFLGISRVVLPRFLSADLLGATLFLLACCLVIRYIKQSNGNRLSNLIFYGLQFVFLLTMVFLKFSLVPAAATIGLSVLLLGYSKPDPVIKKTGFVLLSLFVLAMGVLFLYNKLVSGDGITYNRVTTEKSLHFENLFLFNPFLVLSLFYSDPLYLRFGSPSFDAVLLFATLGIAACIAADVIKKLLQKNAGYFDALMLVSLVSVCGFLSYVSLKFPQDDNGGYSWTFVKEYRYFAPVTLLFLVYGFREFETKRLFRSFSVWPVLMGLAFATTVLLESYYWITNNRSTSFDDIYGSVFRIGNYVKQNSDDDTYFLSLSGDWATDTEITSLAALNGTKVAVTYYNYFPDSTINVLFSGNKPVSAGKKVIVYYGSNTDVLRRLNPVNKRRIEKSPAGDPFIIIQN